MIFNKVILINPASPPGYVSNKDSMGGFGQLYPIGATLLPPLDLVYLAGYLTEKQIPLEIFESLGLELNKEQLVQKAAAARRAARNETVLMIVRTSLPTLDWDLGVCHALKASAPDAQIAIYGAVVTQVLWRIQQESSIDYIIKGEPDEIAHALAIGTPAEQILGLVFRRDGAWVENPSRPFTKALDQLPFPTWELFPYKQYQLPKSSARKEMPFLPMLTSRGCPIGCHYCPYPVGQGLPWRDRSAKNVVDEMEHLVNDLGIRYILLRDPMFSLNQKRVLAICDEIVQRGLKFEWKCETRVDFLKEDTLRAMAKAGCTGVNFGVESSDVEIQKGVGRRPIPPEQFVKTISLCRELGIKTFAFFIIGLPGDTLETTLKTIKFANDIQTTWVQFTAASPFIGTKLRAWAVTQGLAMDDEFAYINSHEVTMGNDHLTREQVNQLLRFAQCFEKYLINRRGILKDATHGGWLRKVAVSTADGVSQQAAQAAYAIGKWYLRRNIHPTDSPALKPARSV